MILRSETEEKNKSYPDWKAISLKKSELDRVLLEKTKGRVHTLMEGLLKDEEIYLYHSYANAVSVRRLGFNDHGPVHARISTYNALKILRLLHESGIPTSLESEEIGTYEDAQVAVALGCFLHDIGMGVSRKEHEWHSVNLADGLIVRYLERLYPNDKPIQIVLRAMTHEVIIGHMARTPIHSVEAGTVLVADGTDMSRGRSRIPEILSQNPMVGDIHRHSASAINRVDITPGDVKPVCIMVTMNNPTGLFQVEEVLMTKVKASPILAYLELGVRLGEEPARFYLR
jgi:metal-dependent HD superfamily phosphatase/phosphodiesterase